MSKDNALKSLKAATDWIKTNLEVEDGELDYLDTVWNLTGANNMTKSVIRMIIFQGFVLHTS